MKTTVLAVPIGVSYRRCNCGRVVPHRELRYYLRVGGKLDHGTAYTADPHACTARRQELAR